MESFRQNNFTAELASEFLTGQEDSSYWLGLQAYNELQTNTLSADDGHQVGCILHRGKLLPVPRLSYRTLPVPRLSYRTLPVPRPSYRTLPVRRLSYRTLPVRRLSYRSFSFSDLVKKVYSDISIF